MRHVISALGLIVLIIFALTIDVGELSHAVTQVKPFWLLTALGLGLVNIYLKAGRWRLMVKEVAHTEIDLPYAFASVFAGVAGASLLPGRAFEVTKPMMLRTSHDIPVRKTFPAVLFERLLDLAALFALFLLSALAASARVQYANNLLYVTATLGLVCLITVILRPRWGLQLLRKGAARFERFKNVSNAMESLERFVDVWQRRDVKVKWLSLSAGAMLAEVARAYAVFAAFDIALSPTLVGFAFSGSILVGLLSLIPGGIGVTETSQYGFLAILLPGAAGSALRGAVLLDRFISYYLLVGIGALVLLLVGRNTRVPAAQKTRSRAEVVEQ